MKRPSFLLVYGSPSPVARLLHSVGRRGENIGHTHFIRAALQCHMASSWLEQSHVAVPDWTDMWEGSGWGTENGSELMAALPTLPPYAPSPSHPLHLQTLLISSASQTITSLCLASPQHVNKIICLLKIIPPLPFSSSLLNNSNNSSHHHHPHSPYQPLSSRVFF